MNAGAFTERPVDERLMRLADLRQRTYAVLTNLARYLDTPDQRDLTMIARYFDEEVAARKAALKEAAS